MKLVVPDGYTINPGDLSWDPLKEFGELVVFDRSAYELSGRLFPNVQSYIDEQYAADQAVQEYCRMREERFSRAGAASVYGAGL